MISNRMSRPTRLRLSRAFSTRRQLLNVNNNIFNHFQQQQRQQQQQPPLPPSTGIKSNAFRRTLILIGAIAISAFAFRQYTRHNYPPEVAKLLRKGLREELDGNGQGKPDYNMALKYYLEALEEADNLKMSTLSDEYTGLQIKICEMYENLGMIEEARLMYRELGTMYVQALADGSIVPSSLRSHIIQRDLRVALKTALHESSINPKIAKMGLLVHFLMAQKEVAKKSPEMANLINGEKDKAKHALNLTLAIDEESINREHAEAWQPFRDELFNARDMFSALCLATGEVGLALQTKIATTEWMAIAGCEVGKVLMSFYNVGSIFYLQSEELEVRGLQDSNEQADLHKSLAKESIENSSKCFKVILDVVEKLPGKMRRDSDVVEAQALSTYGLGVIALHRGEFETAKELLRESRLRAKSCDFEELIKSAETELDKLEVIQRSKMDGDEIQYNPPSMDVLLVQKSFKP